MREYSPKRRTAVVFSGSGTSGAYHAGALKAIDESGVKVDLVVGSGAGALAAAFAAVAGGSRLYGPGGFWDGLRWRSLYAPRPLLAAALALAGFAFALVALPVALGLLAGLLVPVLPLVELAAPGWPARLAARAWPLLSSLAGAYLAALAVPVLGFSVLAAGFLARLVLRRRSIPEALESALDAGRGRARLASGLWHVARGAALSAAPPNERELGKRYVTLLAENLGQPGFRELILRVADLDGGAALPFVLLQDAPRAAFFAASRRGPRAQVDGHASAVDLKAGGHAELLFDAVVTGILAPLAAPVRRVAFPRGGLFGGQTRRLADATLTAGSGLAEALAAGAEQVILVSATPEQAALPLRRRGARAVLDGTLATLERRAIERDAEEAERINRMVDTVGHRTEDGRRAWEDPATGRVYRDFALYLIRPARRSLAPLELDGARDPSTDVVETPADLLEQGYRDGYRLFVEPVVGAEPPRAEAAESEERAPVEL
jgi:hypothetical protein